MNKVLLLSLVISLIMSCTPGNAKFVRKHISNNDISIKWYYYSYITNVSPDFVVVTKHKEEKEIYKANYVIADVSLNGKNIILKLVEPKKERVYTKEVDKEVFGYKIILDSTGSHKDLQNVPDGVKE